MPTARPVVSNPSRKSGIYAPTSRGLRPDRAEHGRLRPKCWFPKLSVDSGWGCNERLPDRERLRQERGSWRMGGNTRDIEINRPFPPGVGRIEPQRPPWAQSGILRTRDRVVRRPSCLRLGAKRRGGFWPEGLCGPCGWTGWDGSGGPPALGRGRCCHGGCGRAFGDRVRRVHGGLREQVI